MYQISCNLLWPALKLSWMPGPASDGIKATKPGLVWVAVGGAVPREGEGERDLGLIFKRVVFPISTYSLGAWDISDGFQGG